jgi:hypothetical protein
MNNYILQFALKKNGQAKICVDGDCAELLACVLTLIKSIYLQTLLNHGETEANLFLEQIGKAMNCPVDPLYEEVRGLCDLEED